MSAALPTWETAKSAHGPAIAQWIEDVLDGQGRTAHSVSEMLERSLSRWRTGERAGFYTVDKYLVMIGEHPMNVPQSIWCSESNRQRYAKRPCWNCGGSGVRCCEFAADKPVPVRAG